MGELGRAFECTSRERSLERALLEASLDEDTLFSILADEHRADNASLPDTDVGLELERVLSPIHIAMPGHGTRASTVLVVREGSFRLVERTIAPGGGEVAIEGSFGE